MKMELDERLMIPERIRIPVLGGIWYRYLCKRKREQIRNVPIQSLSLNREKRETKLIFTLTSFPDRIDSVQYTLRTLFMQSMKPDRVILWLAKDVYKRQVMRSVMNRSITTGKKVHNETVNSSLDNPSAKEEQKIYSYKGNVREFLSFCREFVWKFGKWKNTELDHFIDEFDADVLLSLIHIL